MKDQYKKARARKGVRQKKAPNGNVVKLGSGEGLSLREFKAVKKMLPRVETKMAPIGNFQVLSVPYTTSGELPQIPIIGQTSITGIGFVTGVDKITQGTKDGERIGSRVCPKKLTSHIQWCIDDQKSQSDANPGPYQIRWWVYKVKYV